MTIKKVLTFLILTVTNTVVFDFNFRTQHQGLKKRKEEVPKLPALTKAVRGAQLEHMMKHICYLRSTY